MFFMSGSQANVYAQAAKTMTDRIRQLGPNPLKLAKLKAAQPPLPDEPEEEVNYRHRK
jgi:hypothetical protein